jgi:muramidase (phage lysozyme)
MINREDQKDQKEKSDARDMYSKFIPQLFPQSAGAAPAAAAPRPSGSAEITSPQTAPAKDVYAADEQSPLDPVPGAITPNMSRVLAALQPGESGGKPNVMYGGKTFDDYSQHPNQPQPITSGPNAGKTSTAAGTYQLIKPTWDKAQQALGLQDFSPQNQNAAAAYTASADFEKRTGIPLERAMTEAGNDPQKLQVIARALAPTWTSLPGGIEQNSGGQQFADIAAQRPVSDVSAQQRQPQAAAPSAQPNMGAILPGMLNNKYTAPIAQGVIQQGIQQQFTPKGTDDTKEYEYAQRQGFKGTLFDFITKKKQAGAIQNSVLIDQKGEGAFSTEAGKLQAKRFNDLAEDAPAATQMQSDIAMLRDLGTKIETGKGAEVRAAIGPYAQALGIDIKGLSEIQAYEAIINRVAPNLRVKGSGAQSDFELRNFLKSLPSIGNTPEGNDIASRVLEGLYQNKMAAAEIGSKALTGELTRAEAEKQLRALPDPMKEWREFNKKKPGGETPIDDLLKKYGPR